MILCICNNLSEEDFKEISWEDYKDIQRCGICEEAVREHLGVPRDDH